MENIWDERYAVDEYFFGKEPNAFLVAQRELLKQGATCLAVADGEGRNGVWLAEQGLSVHAVDNSAVALHKARQLAQQRGVQVNFEQIDLLQWDWGENRYDVVVAIFIQFVGPAQRAQIFENIRRCLKPGGLLLLHGYSPRQLEYATGGPSQVENLYTEEMLQIAFSEWEILNLRAYDDHINEGVGHCGMSALIDLVARKPRNKYKVQQVETRLYCATHCHICDKAKSMISQAGIVTHPIDIIVNDNLFQKYRLRIPVLQRVDNHAELDWPFDIAAVSRFLIAKGK